MAFRGISNCGEKPVCPLCGEALDGIDQNATGESKTTCEQCGFVIQCYAEYLLMFTTTAFVTQTKEPPDA